MHRVGRPPTRLAHRRLDELERRGLTLPCREREQAPAERHRRPQRSHRRAQVVERALDRRRHRLPREAQQRDTGRRRKRPQHVRHHPGVPVVPAPIRQAAVEEHRHALAEARVLRPPHLPQGVERVARRLHPGVGVLDPAPPDQRHVVAQQLRGLERLAPMGEQPIGRPLGRPRTPPLGEGPERERRRPARLVELG